jgi:hypothetical protein
MAKSVVLDYVRGKIGAAEYWSAVSADMSFAGFCCGRADWEARLCKAVNSGFWRLHALDRSDPFWKGTNGLATDSKLSEFAFYELANDPMNVDAAHLAIAINLLQCAQPLQVSPWRALLAAGSVDLQFLVCSACASAPYWPDSNIRQTCDLVRALELQGGIEDALQWFAASGDGQAEWVEAIRRTLSG